MANTRSTGTVDLGAGSTINGVPIGGGGGLAVATYPPTPIRVRDTAAGAWRYGGVAWGPYPPFYYSTVDHAWFDNTTYAGPGPGPSQFVVGSNLLAAGPINFQNFYVRIPDNFSSWLPGNVRIQYAIDSFASNANDYTLTLAVENADQASVGTTALTIAGDISHAELQNDLVVDLVGARIGAGDTLQIKFSLARGGTGLDCDFYLGDLRLNWA